MKLFVLVFGLISTFTEVCATKSEEVRYTSRTVRIGSVPFSLLHYKDKRWVVGIAFGAYGNSVSSFYFHKKGMSEKALEASFLSLSPDKKAICLADTALWLTTLWKHAGEDVNPYTFEDLRPSEKKVFDMLLFGGMPFSVTEDGCFKISGVFPRLRSWRKLHEHGKPENAFDFVYDDESGTWYYVSDGLREPMPSCSKVTPEDWIGYAIERKNRTRKRPLPLPNGYDSTRVQKVVQKDSFTE